MLTELSSEKFEWFGPSPIEPFNPGSLSLLAVGQSSNCEGVERKIGYRWSETQGNLNFAEYPAELKGSIGEGPNHSNFSDQSSVKIQELLLNNWKNQECSTFSKISAKFRQNFIKIWTKINEKIKKITKFNFAKFWPTFENVWRNFAEMLRSERCKSM